MRSKLAGVNIRFHITYNDWKRQFSKLVNDRAAGRELNLLL